MSRSGGNVRYGLLSLLTVVVVVAMATAAVLTVTTSSAMEALARREADMTAEGYAAERSAQAMVASVDDILCEMREAKTTGAAVSRGVELVADELVQDACEDGVEGSCEMLDGTLSCTFLTEGRRMLVAELEISNDATYKILSWKLTGAPEEESSQGNLWTGF